MTTDKQQDVAFQQALHDIIDATFSDIEYDADGNHVSKPVVMYMRVVKDTESTVLWPDREELATYYVIAKSRVTLNDMPKERLTYIHRETP